jgi:hypothetical protein
MLAPMTTTATEMEGATMKIWRKRRRLVLGLALGLTAASVLAAPAQAKPDDLEGTLSYSSDSTQLPVRPDDQAVRISPVADQLAVDGGAVQYTDSGSVSAAPKLPDSRAEHRLFDGGVQTTPVTTDDGVQIDWRDAGFGALGATALLALMAGMALAVRRNRHTGGLAAS